MINNIIINNYSKMNILIISFICLLYFQQVICNCGFLVFGSSGEVNHKMTITKFQTIPYYPNNYITEHCVFTKYSFILESSRLTLLSDIRSTNPESCIQCVPGYFYNFDEDKVGDGFHVTNLSLYNNTLSLNGKKVFVWWTIVLTTIIFALLFIAILFMIFYVVGIFRKKKQYELVE
jgi:hypothetical protein